MSNPFDRTPKEPFGWISYKISNFFWKKYIDKVGATSEEIVEKDKLAKKEHPFLCKIEDICDNIHYWIEHRIIDLFKKPRIFWRNYKDKTHIIPTSLKMGEWHDARTRLEEGMFHLIKWFVEHEDKRGIEWYKELKAENKLHELDSEHQKECYKVCIDAQTPEEHTHLMASFNRRTRESTSLAYDMIHKYEKIIDDRNAYHMHKIVDIYLNLWS
jgi:hypothetical protein